VRRKLVESRVGKPCPRARVQGGMDRKAFRGTVGCGTGREPCEASGRWHEALLPWGY
jgi:hypothetical protein